MRWQDRRQSDNVEDRRNEQMSQAGIGGLGALGLGLLMRGGSKGLLVLIVLFIGLKACGYDPIRLFFGDGMLTQTSSKIENQSSTPVNDERTRFISTVLAGTEDTWNKIFAEKGAHYVAPGLVLFRSAVRSSCGVATSAVGPFYCPLDRKIYLDETFFDQLDKQFGAPGEAAQAYVIAHEIGHHVQNLTGELSSEKQENEMSVRTELQADCYAGIWAHYAAQQGMFETGDISIALNAAHKIGDDTLQQRTQGYAVPDSFTHGTAEQRATWFKRGFDSGAMSACNTGNGGM